ncbi:MAG TPA: ABC transporter substrate-binding protein [Candidatus Kapabacteria bacterium]|nr:ABC transporter substrate-binding protein [Candidatus Kapabacteria bacterium]
MPRILSLLPSATEIVFEIGAGQALVGVTHECDYPAEAHARPRVTSAKIEPSMASEEIDRLVREQLDDSGTLYALDLDLVRELRPTIVLTQQLCTVCAVGYATVHAAMRALPEPPEVINLEPRTLDEVFATITQVGELAGVPERGAASVHALRRRLATIPFIPRPPRVLFLEWLIPPFSAGHWMGDLVVAAGAIPVLADRGGASHGLAWEAIAAAEFDAVVISCCGFGVERTLQDVERCTELRRLLDARPSVRLIVFDGNHFFSRPGPRLVESAELLHHALMGRDPSAVHSSIAEPYRILNAS